MSELDVVVIGAGPAGENAAGRCAQGGLAVALVERELVGGECTYWGCMPSKVLIRPGDALSAARRVRGAERAVTGPVDVDETFATRDDFTSHWDDEGSLGWLTDRGVEIARGAGRLTAARTVEVTDSAGEMGTLRPSRAVVVATGTTASIPPVPGLAEVQPWTNREATAAKEVPRRLVVLGGGAIGLELAQAFRRLGSDEVTVLEAAPRLLSREEPFAGEEIREALEAEGVTTHVGVSVTSVRRDPDGSVVAALEDGRAVVGDEILVAVGRRPNTDDLGVDAVGLEPGMPVEVDRHLRAKGVPGGWLYAVGDCNGRSPLTHMGKYQGRVAADVILGRDASAIADEGMVPRVTFTDPQVAAVGLTEAEAREKGADVRVVRHGTGQVAGAKLLATEYPGSSQLVVDEERRVLLGATFVGATVQELLHSATVAIAGEVTLDRLWHAVPSFPTVSEVWLRLLEAYGM